MVSLTQERRKEKRKKKKRRQKKQKKRINKNDKKRTRKMRDKNPPHTQQGSVSLYFYSFNLCFFICSLFFKLCTINAGSYRKREERVYAKKVKKVSENLA